jgi:2-polyprenyl-3-methyl-5-hydroxy-6-metoxy-1,4-benzoquinol methylase
MEQGLAYYNHDRSELLRFVPDLSGVALDVGCGAGRFGALLKAERGLRVVGVEANLEAAAAASAVLDECCVGEYPEVAPPGEFDLICFNDVLEHMIEPEAALLSARSQLKAGGTILASVPNVRHFDLLFQLLIRGDWQYANAGILDRTHLRFYTRRSIERLFSDCSLTVVSIEGIARRSAYPMAWRLLRTLRSSELLSQQFVVLAVSMDQRVRVCS